MSLGPPDALDDSEMGPDDAARPTRPSERGAWRNHDHDTTDDEVDAGVSRLPLA
ncbi:hypothetical protein [Kineosporia sp. NBRC 101731]|uniref:hypothetical protein n=1 Tax=Kineosporia sp. NBRC 101731 TaxID=3032199 RepID=UPI0024A1C61E|nr:hypothetical protein [Kineosporia sp. NBRC 101731]GLY27382.1 hypothetical protein Kisp02_07470 [Kineosporia sp. NBRC 101731]